MRRVLLSALVAVGALAGFVQGATLAVFTDPATSNANLFATGSVDISTTPQTVLFSSPQSNMIPGDKVTAPLTVTNSNTPGVSLPLTYSLSSSVSGVLGAQLDLTIKRNVAACTNSGFDDPNDVNDVTLYTGALANATVLSNQGPLLVGASHVLCFQITLRSTTGSSSEGTSATGTFTFAAQQV